MPEHDRALRLLGGYRLQLGEISAQRDRAFDRVAELEARLRHPAGSDGRAA